MKSIHNLSIEEFATIMPASVDSTFICTHFAQLISMCSGFFLGTFENVRK